MPLAEREDNCVVGLPARFNSEAPSSRRLQQGPEPLVSLYLPSGDWEDPELAALRAMIETSPALTGQERAALVLTACGSSFPSQELWRERLQDKLGFSSPADLARCALRLY